MFFRLIFRQLSHSRLVNLLLLVTMTALVSLYVFVLNTNRFSVRSMQLIMKQLGLNQIIIPDSQSAMDSYLCTDNQKEFPDRVTHELAGRTELLSRYYVSVLQQRMPLGEHTLLVTGIQPVKRADETSEKGNPVLPVKPGAARLGMSAAELLSVREGDQVRIGERRFAVDSVVPQLGTLDDYRVFLNLADMQDMAGKSGVINLIKSFECLHVGGTLEEIHQWQEAALAEAMPGYKQINIDSIAKGRFHARQMTEKYQYYLLGVVSAITILIIVITGFQEVADRRHETGVLIAQGAGYAYIVGLYLSKTLGLMLVASGVGFLLGSSASVWLTSPFLKTQTQDVAIVWENLAPTVAMICGIGLMAECIPMLKLIRQDPCLIVMEE